MSKHSEMIRELKREKDLHASEKEELLIKIEDLEKSVQLYKEQIGKLKGQFKDKDKAINDLKRTNDEIVRKLIYIDS